MGSARLARSIGTLLAAAALFGGRPALAAPPPARDGSARALELNEQGVQRAAAGRHREAIRLFEEALRLAPGVETIRSNLGKAYASLAVAILEESSAAEGDLVEDPRVVREALAALDRSLLHWPGDEDTHHARALCQLRLGDSQAAERSLAQAVLRDPQRFRSWRLLAVVRERLDRLDGAEQAWRRAAALRPADPWVERRLARLLHDRKAIATYRRLESPRFRIFYPPELPPRRAQELAATLDEASRAFERRWSLRAPEGATVVCYPPGRFAASTGLNEEVGGAFDGRIRIAFPAELEEGGLRAEVVARHELVHLFLHRLPTPPPRWLDEGLAQLLDGDPREGWGARFAELRRRHPGAGLGQWAGAFRDDDPRTWGPLYLAGFLFLQHIAERYGALRIDMLVREAARGRSWEETFELVYGASAGTLERRWREEMKGAAATRPRR